MDVDLIDIDPNWRALGAGLTLNGATLRAMKMLGVLAEVVDKGHVHGGRRVHSSNGTLISEAPYYRPAAGDLMAGGGILRAALHQILSARVLELGTKVTLGVTIDAIRQAHSRADVQLSDGSTATYDLVVGADGIMSKVRQLIMPDAGAPEFTGQGCWRAIFDRPQHVRANWLFVDQHIKIGFNPVSDTKMYMFILESAPGNPWRDAAEWPEMLAERMRACGGLVGELAGTVTAHSMPNYRPLETLLLTEPWHRGRVVLLGDAAHATTPHAGYGAGLAIEDGIVLAEALEANDEVETALSAYAKRRYPRCRDVIEHSLALGRMEMAGANAEAQMAASASLFALTRAEF
jgi:2-polyprenyl-6-methoxyphenol hydroxylase-like FAD-dependent oxidoreductase